MTWNIVFCFYNNKHTKRKNSENKHELKYRMFYTKKTKKR